MRWSKSGKGKYRVGFGHNSLLSPEPAQVEHYGVSGYNVVGLADLRRGRRDRQNSSRNYRQRLAEQPTFDRGGSKRPGRSGRVLDLWMN